MSSRIADNRNQEGAALVIVLVMVAVLGLGAGIAGSTWKSVMQRAREQELFWRGDQYRRAIESYYRQRSAGAVGAYPTNLEALLEDPRSTGTLRHIRRLYADPFTGEPFVPIREGGSVEGSVAATTGPGWIVGVRSAGTLVPFRQEGFEEPYEAFAGARSYAEWEFVFRPRQPPRTPGQDAVRQGGDGDVAPPAGRDQP